MHASGHESTGQPGNPLSLTLQETLQPLPYCLAYCLPYAVEHAVWFDRRTVQQTLMKDVHTCIKTHIVLKHAQTGLLWTLVRPAIVRCSKGATLRSARGAKPGETDFTVPEALLCCM
jgi:hypothetical protein